MSAPAPFPRTPSSGASTDPRWQPESGGLPEPLAWPSPTATGTIVPPSPAEPEAARHPADARLSDAENALMAARRNAVNALEWIDRALRDLRKARQS